ncbi:Uncharacterized 50 kDa protein in type I retrotransposable element R1DM [Anthophora retusa]
MREAAQEAIKKIKEKHELELQVQAFTHTGDAPAPSRSSMPLPEEEDIIRKMRERPTADLGAEVLEHMREVEVVAAKSTNLKGPFVRKLRIAAMSVRHAVTELSKRTTVTDSIQKLERDNVELRSRIADLEGQLETLKVKQSVAAATTAAITPDAAPAREERMEVLASRAVSPIPTVEKRPSIRKGSSSAEKPRRKEEDMEETLFRRIGDMVDAKLSRFLAGLHPTLPTGDKVPTEENRKETAVKEPVIEEAPPTKKKKSSGVGPTRNVGNRETDNRAVGKRTIDTRAADKRPDSEEGVTTRPTTQAAVPAPAPQVTWSKVVGRKSKKVTAETSTTASSRPASSPATLPTGTARRGATQAPPKVRLARAPRTSAVTVTVTPEAKMTYGEAMSMVRQKIDLKEIGIDGVRHRLAVTGGHVLEVPGPESSTKAATLAEKMSSVLAQSGVKVANPTKRAEVRLRGLDESVRPQEVIATVAAFTDCRESDIRVGKVRTTASNMGTLWVQCPLIAARKLVAAGRITIGWYGARVEALAPRKLQCYRCLEFGHTRSRCTNEVDRSGMCYRCGDTSHTASNCTADPKCPLCAQQGRPAGHRLGGPGCAPTSTSKRKKPSAPSAGANATPASAMGPAGADKLPKQGTSKEVPTSVAGKLPTVGKAVEGGLEETMVTE